jgi:hypothetical protein
MYYKKGVVREEIVAIVIISCAASFVLGGSIGFLLATICAMASDKNQQVEGEVKSSVVKRSIIIAGQWRGLKDIAWSRRTTLSNLISRIDLDRERGNLSSALRLFLLNHYQAQVAA